MKARILITSSLAGFVTSFYCPTNGTITALACLSLVGVSIGLAVAIADALEGGR